VVAPKSTLKTAAGERAWKDLETGDSHRRVCQMKHYSLSMSSRLGKAARFCRRVVE
jgi:hypothetical protein